VSHRKGPEEADAGGKTVELEDRLFRKPPHPLYSYKGTVKEFPSPYPLPRGERVNIRK
jgi:hypothetical protein